MPRGTFVVTHSCCNCIGIWHLRMREMLVTCIKQPFAYAIVWVLCFVLWVGPGIAAECQRDNFENWLEAFKQEASAQGLSQRTIAFALNGVAYDPAVIAHDRSQSVFQQSFGAVLWPCGLAKPLAEGCKHAQTLRVYSGTDRGALRCAGSSAGGDLGP